MICYNYEDVSIEIRTLIEWCGSTYHVALYISKIIFSMFCEWSENSPCIITAIEKQKLSGTLGGIAGEGKRKNNEHNGAKEWKVIWRVTPTTLTRYNNTQEVSIHGRTQELQCTATTSAYTSA